MGRFIMLPPKGLRATLKNGASTHLRDAFKRLSHLRLNQPLGMMQAWAEESAPTVRMLADLAKNGAKLFEMNQEEKARIRTRYPGMRLLPDLTYRLATMLDADPGGGPVAPTQPFPGGVTLILKSSDTGTPVPGVRVTIGDARFVSDEQGRLHLPRPNSAAYGTLLLVTPPQFVSRTVLNAAPPGPPNPISLQPARTLLGTDLLQISMQSLPGSQRGAGVRVAIIDTGVDDNHPDLQLAGGMNTVPMEDPDDYGPAGIAHGTHVAGIIAGRGSAPQGMRGVAPEVELYSFRVTPRATDESALRPTSWSVLHAIDAAVAAKCDIINLSLTVENRDDSLPTTDESVQEAVARARSAGAILVCAAGNSERLRIRFPAADERALAVAAHGRASLGKGRAEELYETEDTGDDADLFVPSFCCSGDTMDFTAPGVGIVSTILNGGYGIMSGTSMAAPAISGRIAELLSSRPDLLALPRDNQRSDAMMSLALSAAKTLGFPRDLEGNGSLGSDAFGPIV